MLRVLLLSKIICSLLKSGDVGMPQDLTAVLSKDMQKDLVKFKLDIVFKAISLTTESLSIY